MILQLVMLSSAIGKDIRVTSLFDTTHITIGDHVGYSVRIEQPAGISLEVVTLKDTLTNGIEILRGPDKDTLYLDEERLAIYHRYLVTSFDTGRYEVRPIYAEMHTESAIRRFHSDYAYIKVERPDIAPPDTETGFYDIIEPYRAPLTPGEVMPWMLLTAAILFILWLVMKYIRGRRAEGLEAEIVPPEAAHILAYRSLEKLRSEKLWQQGRYKEYFIRISFIVREYIDNRYGLNSLESTSEETLAMLGSSEMNFDDVGECLKDILTLSDLVKFAKHTPEDTDCEICMEHAWNFVSKTRKERLSERADESGKSEQVKERSRPGV